VATLKKYDLQGKNIGEESIDESLLETSANLQMIKDYLVKQRANRRQWSASTQTRAEVSHSKKKPHPQKGTGNARQGFLGSPQFRGGGRVHAPKPKFDQHTRINKKERRLSIRHLLTEKIKAANAHILEYSTPLKTPQTKALAKFLEALQVSGKRILFLGEQGGKDFSTLSLSLRNIPKVTFIPFANVSGEDLALASELIILDSAVDNLKKTLGGE
jgi:large subunit ribosomal protein L4